MNVFGTLLIYAMFMVTFIVFMGVVVSVVITVMAAREIKHNAEETRKQIMKMLPKEDCGQCGYEECNGYASSAVIGTEQYRPCPKCSNGLNSRISLMWVSPKGKA